MSHEHTVSATSTADDLAACVDNIESMLNETHQFRLTELVGVKNLISYSQRLLVLMQLYVEDRGEWTGDQDALEYDFTDAVDFANKS